MGLNASRCAFVCAVTLAASLCFAACPSTATAAPSPDAKAVSAKGVWKEKGSTVSYKVAGKAVKGLVSINGKSYYFDSKGVQRTGWRCVYGIYYHFNTSNKSSAYATVNKVVNGVKLNKYGQAVLANNNVKAELQTMVRAQSLLDKLASPLDSKSTKLKKCFKYLINPKKITERVLHPWTTQNGWWRLFANDIFVDKAGDCNSMGFAMAYLGNAAGYKKCECVSSGGHSWARINGRVYDPQQRNYNVGGVAGGVHYQGAGIYHVNLSRGKVWPGKKIENPGVSTTKGLVKRNGEIRYYNTKGKMVASKWVTVKSKRYYFESTGEAVRGGSIKIKGSYYVFNKNAVLQKGKGVRIVKIVGVKYQVKASGKAKSGWNADKTMRFKENGALCTGVELVGGKLFAFGNNGICNQTLTESLREAAKDTFNASVLLGLLGKPSKSFEVESCAPTVGPDGIVYDKEDISLVVYEYAHIRVQTMSFKFIDDSGVCEKISDISAR